MHQPARGRPGFLIRADPALWAELEYCLPLGIPHSVFEGRVVGPTSPQWTEEDRLLWRAWREHKTRQCKDCGTWPEEWERNRDAYVGDDHICPGCAVLHREGENDPDPKGTPGRKIGLVPGTEDAAEVAFDEIAGIDTLASVLKRREAEPLQPE